MSDVVEHEGVKVPAPEGWSGDVFVRVVSAVEREWHEMGRGRVKEAFPALIVSTYPFSRGERMDETGTGVKYRGRTYFVEDAQMFGNDGWSSDHRTNYTRGYKNESGSSVDWKSPMRSRLHEFVSAVRDAYVAEHLEWVRESKALRLRWMIDHEASQADSARREAEKHDAAAERSRQELQGLLQTL